MKVHMLDVGALRTPKSSLGAKTHPNRRYVAVDPRYSKKKPTDMPNPFSLEIRKIFSLLKKVQEEGGRIFITTENFSVTLKMRIFGTIYGYGIRKIEILDPKKIEEYNRRGIFVSEFMNIISNQNRNIYRIVLEKR